LICADEVSLAFGAVVVVVVVENFGLIGKFFALPMDAQLRRPCIPNPNPDSGSHPPTSHFIQQKPKSRQRKF